MMHVRVAALALISIAWAMLGASCFPLVDLSPGSNADPNRGETLAVSFVQPTVTRTVPGGTQVPIEWTAGNLAGGEALVTIFVERRPAVEFEETILDAVLVDSSAGQALTWDTTGFTAGEYRVKAVIELEDRREETTAPGRITIDGPIEFEFTEPTADRVVDRNLLEDEDEENDADALVRIQWTARDPEGTAEAEIFIDPDRDHENDNEVLIGTRPLLDTTTNSSILWDGTDDNDEPVDEGMYHLFARLDDGVNDERLVDGLAQITVIAADEPEPEPEPVELAITMPEEDVTFLPDDDPITITFTLEEEEDVLVDLKIDVDSDNTNGNEQTILSRRTIETGTTEDSFDWDGEALNPDTNMFEEAADGIYSVLLVLNTGGANFQQVRSPGLIFKRSDENQPLVALTAPARDQTVTSGALVQIVWRDDDPTEDGATIRLFLDDDGMPNEGTETDDPEIEISPPDGFPAADDGVNDTFAWSVPGSLDPGLYFLFAYVDTDDSDPPDHISTAAGRIIVDDPLN